MELGKSKQWMLGVAVAMLVTNGSVWGEESAETDDHETQSVYIISDEESLLDDVDTANSTAEESFAPPPLPTEVMTAAALKKLQEQPELSPTVEEAPSTLPSPAAAELSSIFSVSQASIISQLSAARQSDGGGPSSDFVLGVESSILSTSDIGDLLSKSNAILGIGSEHRTPIVTYNVARGKQVGQQAGAGSYWFPARQDLDTLMNKIDSRIVDNVLVVQGPYTARYGPGLSFYDMQIKPAPRYASGYESHGMTSLDWKHNGDQWYGRQTIMGGSSTWGYRIGYGDRTGSDYSTGLDNGLNELSEMPTSYHSKDWDVVFGWDPSPYQHLDFTYLRIDQSDVEFPGQILDFDFLVTDAVDLTYVNDCPGFCDRVELEGWYNRTRFAGNAQGAGKRRQIPLLSDYFGLGPLTLFTDVDASSAGYSFATTWGCEGCPQFTAGTDFRYLKQQLNEFGFAASQFVVGFPNNRSIPRAYSSNPGVFAELEFPMTPCLDVELGGRFDLVYTNAYPNVDRDMDGVSDDLEQQLGGSFDQSFNLHSFYATADYQFDCHWTASAGAGYAMRPPTMTELYADGPFIAAMPQFVFTRLVGNPNIQPERMWQVDAGLEAKYSDFNGGLRGFHSWIDNYITYLRPPGFEFTAVNDTMATLTGFEVYSEVDLTCQLTGFATAQYVEGKNRARNEPLPSIPPLESRSGIRLHQASENPMWAVEFSARIVNDQDRVAASLVEVVTPGFTTFDLRAYSQMTENLLVTVGVENLFDRFYQEHLDPHTVPLTGSGFANYGVYQPGINIYTGIVWEY